MYIIKCDDKYFVYHLGQYRISWSELKTDAWEFNSKHAAFGAAKIVGGKVFRR